MSARMWRILVVGAAAAGTIAVARSTQSPGGANPAAQAVRAAETFLSTLDERQRAKANPELNDRTRTIWSNLPTGITMQVGATERNGVKLGELSPAQEKAALALLSGTLSADGFRKAMSIVDADQMLEVQSAPTRPPTQAIRFGRAEYYLSVLGKPSTTEKWMVQFGGHHLAINVTFAGERVLAPTHTGTQPATYTIDGKTIRPLGDENDKAFALINALNAEQQKQAVLGVEVRNLVLGPGVDGKAIEPEGVRVATFTPAQRTMLLDLVGEWVGILDSQAAAAKMKEIQGTLDDTYFAWAGATTNGKGAYFRIQGPVALIEYAPQGRGEANIDHIHTIYREPSNDYAAELSRR